jgi:hypothetical protein
VGKRVLEEDRYDALGRRVWVRRAPECNPVNAIDCVTGFARRTVWDGGQEVAEIQAPLDPASASVEEQDGGWALLAFEPAAGTYGDPNPFYGRVVYGPGLAVDQPLSVTRYAYRDRPGTGPATLTWPRLTPDAFKERS